MAPLYRSSSPSAENRNSLDEPLLVAKNPSSPSDGVASPPVPTNKRRRRLDCNKLRGRICRVCRFWRCASPADEDYDTPPAKEEEWRQGSATGRSAALLERNTSSDVRHRRRTTKAVASPADAAPALSIQRPHPRAFPARPAAPQSRLRSKGIDPASWMASLPDHVQLETLYLPGTHQSLALNYPFTSSLCQTTSLTSQLQAGIRCLDLRFALLPNSNREGKDRGGKEGLWAYHGPVPQGREMGEVFEEIYAFFESEEGRNETVIVSIKQENAGHEFAARVWDLIDSTRPYMWYDRNEWPTLAQVRGRCVMFCRFGFESGRGLHPPIWPNDKPYAWRTEIGGRETVVQDWYGVRSPISIPQKANLVLSLFDSSSSVFSGLTDTRAPSQTATGPSELQEQSDEHQISEPPPLPLRINFLSCASFPTLYPSHAAKGFGVPRLGMGYRGVNKLVGRGLDRLEREEVEGRVSVADLRDGARSFALAGVAAEEEEEKELSLATLPAMRTPSGTTHPPQPALARTQAAPQPTNPRAPTKLSAGRQRREGQGGMLLFMDFWESPRRGSLVERVIGMNF
ncbi:hypothetical protein JCM10908_003056 [Rhodotorula pacifica]|uniref:uncharacterized protein n=1 Tax=Rhodotorula pacifica TaxID=1495444 RepID=UPI003174BCC3